MKRLVKEKKCSRCGEIKPREAFSPDKRATTGLYAACKECCTKARKAKYRDDPNWRKRRRKQNNDSKERRKELRAAVVATPHNKKVRNKRESKKRQSSGYRKKMQARRAVRSAIEQGRMIKPSLCSRCGTAPGTARDGRSLLYCHHYNGYDEKHWLDVEWVCVHCDRKSEGALKRKVT